MLFRSGCPRRQQRTSRGRQREAGLPWLHPEKMPSPQRGWTKDANSQPWPQAPSVVNGSHRVTGHQAPWGHSGAPILPVPPELCGSQKEAEIPLSRIADWPLNCASPPLSGELQLSAASMPSHRDVGPWGCSSISAHVSCLGLVTHPRMPRQGNLHLREMDRSSLPLAFPMHSAFFLKSHPTPQG